MKGNEAEKMAALIQDFFSKVEGDKELEGILENVAKESFQHHPETFHSHSFGEQTYSKDDIQRAHAHLDIEDKHFDSMVNHFVETLDLHGYSGDERDKAMEVLNEYREMVAKQKRG